MKRVLNAKDAMDAKIWYLPLTWKHHFSLDLFRYSLNLSLRQG